LSDLGNFESSLFWVDSEGHLFYHSLP